MLTIALAGLALLVALVALALVRRQARRLSQLTEMYWQLKYDHGELKATVSPPAPGDPPPPPTSFVPLGAVKRSSS
jgi:hypothetical protein